MARCTTGTTAIRNSDSVVWQSAATGMDQDDLAVAWSTPLLQAGALPVSQPPTPAGKATAGDPRSWRLTGGNRQSRNVFKVVKDVT